MKSVPGFGTANAARVGTAAATARRPKTRSDARVSRGHGSHGVHGQIDRIRVIREIRAGFGTANGVRIGEIVARCNISELPRRIPLYAQILTGITLGIATGLWLGKGAGPLGQIGTLVIQLVKLFAVPKDAELPKPEKPVPPPAR